MADSNDPFYVGILAGWTVPCPIGDQVVSATRAGPLAFVSNIVSLDDAGELIRSLPHSKAPAEQALLSF